MTSDFVLENEPLFEYFSSEEYFSLNLYEDLTKEELVELIYHLQSLEHNFQQLYDGSRLSSTSHFICRTNSRKMHTVVRVNNYLASLNSFSNFIKQITEKRYGKDEGISINVREKSDEVPPKEIQRPASFLIETRHIVQHTRKRIYKIHNEDEVVYISVIQNKFEEYSDHNEPLDVLPKNSDTSVPEQICKYHNKTRGLIKDAAEAWKNRREDSDIHNYSF